MSTDNGGPQTAELNGSGPAPGADLAVPDATPAPVPEPAERGRYAVFLTDTGGWAIARSAPICERCQSCGCGEQAEPIKVPPFVVAVITGEADPRVKLREIMQMMRGMASGG